MTQLHALRDLRTAHRLSQAQLAELLGVTISTVSNWENRRSRPRDEMIERLAGIFGVKPEELALHPPSRKGHPIGHVFPPETIEKLRRAGLRQWYGPYLREEPEVA